MADQSALAVPFWDEELRHLSLAPLKDDIERVQRLLMKELTGRDRFLGEVTSHLAAAGGKRLRPVLVLCGAYGAQRGAALEPAPDDAIVAAAAVEAMHLCTLYHDDVMDEATLRRSVPSANAQWGNRIAVIGGDILLARAFMLGASLGSAHVAQLAWAIDETCAGQAGELSFLYDPDRDEAAYERSIVGKTASLMMASLHMGGLAAGVGPDDLVRLSAAGRDLGIAFQLVDDLLDILGSAWSIGKPASGADMAAGVYTLPVIVELRTNARLRDLLSSPPSPAEVEEARQIVVAGEGPAVTARRARDHVARALTTLDEGHAHPAVRRAMAQLGDLVLEPIRSLHGTLVAR